MPWIKEEKLYPLLVLILIFIIAVRMPMDSDMWWHLKAGQETLRTGAVYQVDTFSSTRMGDRWINHSWLSQVLMAGLLRVGNFAGLSIWVAACAVLSLGLVYLQMEGHPLLRSAVLVLAAIVSSVVWSPRPQIMSLVLLGLITWILYSYRKKKNWLYLLGVPLILGLWGNLHGGYVLGLIYLGGFVSGEVLDKILLKNSSGELSWKEISLVGGTIGLGLGMVLLNPFGFEIWKIPFNTVGIETLQNLINEWSSPDFHQAFQQPFLWMLLGLLGVLALTKKPLDGYRLVPILLFAGAALVARRNFGPFAIIAAPALAGQLQAVLEEWISKARKINAEFDNFIRSADANKQSFNVTGRNLINLTLIGLLLTAAVIKTIQVNDPDLVSKVEREFFPVGAAEWLNDKSQTANLFNDYNWGGYLIYHVPQVPVFVDGRTDLYGDEILNDYINIIFCKESWMETLNEYDIDLVIVPADSCLKSLAVAGGWQVLYEEENSIVLGNEITE